MLEGDSLMAQRNDLPQRAARRIIAALFPERDLPATSQRDVVTTAIVAKLELDMARAITEEMVTLEGEIALGMTQRTADGRKLPA